MASRRRIVQRVTRKAKSKKNTKKKVRRVARRGAVVRRTARVAVRRPVQRPVAAAVRPRFGPAVNYPAMMRNLRRDLADCEEARRVLGLGGGGGNAHGSQSIVTAVPYSIRRYMSDRADAISTTLNQELDLLDAATAGDRAWQGRLGPDAVQNIIKALGYWNRGGNGLASQVIRYFGEDWAPDLMVGQQPLDPTAPLDPDLVQMAGGEQSLRDLFWGYFMVLPEETIDGLSAQEQADALRVMPPPSLYRGLLALAIGEAMQTRVHKALNDVRA